MFETNLTAECTERHTADGFWAGKTLNDYLDEVAEHSPEKIAYIDARRSITFGELKTLSDRCALGLLELGIRPGDVVSYQLPNWIEYVVLCLGASRIGAVSNPLIPIYREREVGFMVELAESKLVVVPEEFRGFDYPAMIDGLKGRWPSREHVMVVGSEPGGGSFGEFLDTPWEERRDVAELDALRPNPNDVTLLIFTSGTTGEPKGVMHTHNTLGAAVAPYGERFGITDADVMQMASTLAHLTGFLFAVRLPLQYGVSTVLQDVWNAEQFMAQVAEHGVTMTAGATPFLHDLLNNVPDDPSGLSTLRLFCCMGATIPRPIVRLAAERLPGMTVLGGWGQSENSLVTIGRPGDPEEKTTTTDGYPFAGMEVRTADPDNTPTAAGIEGRVQIRGPFLFVGYAKRLEMTADLHDSDGWFDTGDLGVIDEDGYLSITGRSKDIIIRGGENIPVAHVENALYENQDFAAVAIVGVPDPRLQERACACLVMKDGVEPYTLQMVQDFLKEKGVAKGYWPERVEVLDGFPTTPSGKIQKFQLREIVTT